MAVIDTYSGTPANSARLGDSTTLSYYNAQQFTATANGTIPSVKWYSRINDGSPTDGITLQIWTDSSDSPGSLISGATVDIAHASIVDGANSWNVSEFTTCTLGTAPTVVNGTKYWVVTKRQGVIDSTNYYNAWTIDGGSTYAGGIWKYGNSSPTWTEVAGRDQALEVTITEATGATINVPTLLTLGVG
jgi:hypothetical protein